MPVDWEGHFKRILEDIESTLQSIRRSALAHANDQNFEVSERLRRELETIRISADTILEAISKASVTDYTIDGRLIDWLISGELPSCLGKLKEMDNMLTPVTPVRPIRGTARPLRPGEDVLVTAMVFFDRNKSPFHFLMTPDVWNCERLIHQPPGSEAGALPTGALLVSGATEDRPQERQTSNVAESNLDHTSKTRHLRESQRRQLEEIMRWLAALNCTDKHNYIYQLRQDGTCKWFPKTDVYGKWRTRGAQSLWLHGRAGCGKSVLVASTIEHLKTMLQFQEVVVFFYFDFQTERSRSPVEMMRSLLSQLCRHLIDLDVDPGNFPGTMLEEKGRGTLSLDDLDKLRGLVSCAADRFVREPIVVIDALDECAGIDALFSALVTLHEDNKVRLLVTSRPHQDMIRHFTKISSLSFEDMARELAADIELHVEREIGHNQLKFASPGMKSEIRTKLHEKADGRFRWVQCQIDILKRCTTAQELKKALDDLPTELEATYERILDAIDERRSEGMLARRVLAWLMVALEPLRLVQILDTLSVDFPSQQSVIREGAELIDMLSSLVLHYKETDVVSLSHFSVKEYLTGCTTLPMYKIVPNEAHAEAVQSCMHYISAFIKQAPFRRNIATSKYWPMLSYVFSFGFKHLAHVDHQSSVVLDAVQCLGSDVHHHPSHWDRLCRLREEDLPLSYPPWPSSRHDFTLYVLVAYASVGLFQTFLSGHRPIKARIGTNPLVYAADLRKTNHAIALLSCGGDVNARSLAIDDSHYISPLEVCIDRDEDVLVDELLQRGCPVTSELLTTAVCLPWCSVRVLVKLVYTHEFEEWGHAIGNEKLCRAIFSSARPNAGDIRRADEDHVALARRLRQIGQDLSADSPFGAELIERALHAAHTSTLEYLLPADRPPPVWLLLAASTGDTSETVSTVRFLLGRGADINAVSECGNTVLHLAAMCPWEPRSLDLIKMFIDAGCNPRILNSRGQTIFTIAVKREYQSVVKYLLLSNIFSPSSTLLSALQQRVAPKTVTLLVHNGADVHSISSDGETVLHLAITEYEEPWCLELLRCFIEAGCNTTIRNSKGNTVLHSAIKDGYTSVVKLLLSYNAPLPRDILPFTLLQRHSHMHGPQLVRHLIRNGADVHSTSYLGESVIRLAITMYSEPMCLELVMCFIEAGCDTAACNFTRGTALHAAVKRGYTSVVEFLLSQNVPLPYDILPFALRRRSHPRLVQPLIRSGADVDSTSSRGETIFHLTISHYDESMCLELLKNIVEAGSNPTTWNLEGETALHIAVEYRYTSVVELLLSQNVPLPCDILPFALRRRSHPHLVQLLIRSGADVDSTSSEGETIFHLTISNYDESMCLELLKNIVEAGSNPTTWDLDGETALHTAVECSYTSVVEFLLSQNVPLPCDILAFALRHRSHPQLIRPLIRSGADVDSTSSEGETIFHLTISNYDESMCLELLKSFVEAGGNPTSWNSDEETTLHTAIRHGYIPVVELLLPHNDPLPRDILPFSLQQCSPPQLVQLLIRSGADVTDSTSSEGETIFRLAINNYDESVCLELLESFVKAGGNPTPCNSQETLALMDSAIDRGYIYVFEFLLKCTNVHSTISNGEFLPLLAIVRNSESMCLAWMDCTTNIYSLVGEAVLRAAIKRGYTFVVNKLLPRNAPIPHHILPFALQQSSPLQLIRLLIRNGADIHSTPSEGETIFHLAIANYDEYVCLELVKSFVEAGGNTNIRNSKGQTVLQAAIKRGYFSVVETLLSYDIPVPLGLREPPPNGIIR